MNKLNNKLYRDTTDFFRAVEGLFVDLNLESRELTLYGNNKGIVGINKNIIKLTLDECRKLIGKESYEVLTRYINEKLINNNSLEICIGDNENRKWIRIQGATKEKNRVLKGFEGYLKDITEKKENKNTYILDPVTGLNKKDYFEEKVSKELLQNKIDNKRSALVILGLDNFKYINDSFGKKYGDLFLKIISEELKSIKDDCYLCRLMGDEFLIFFKDIDSLNQCEEKVKYIIEIFNKSYYIQDKYIYVTTSVGIAIYPNDGVEYKELLKNADAAMYMAKSNGKNQYQFFNKNIASELDRIYTIEKELVAALEKEEMFVVFQPKVSLDKEAIEGFEALIRWKNKELGNISPIEFIPIAESNGSIIEIGKFVLKEVFIKAKFLIDSGYKDFRIAFNLSEVQLREGSIINYFKKLIEEYGNLGEYIEIEITESMLMKSVDNNISALISLKEFGASVALDDFGTGYSSFSHLRKLPIDVLKIDRSFVIDMIENSKSQYIIENIIQLSHKLGIKVVAEGVEEAEQVNYLKKVFCDVVQGYYYSKPKEFEQILELLERTNG